MRTSRRPAAAAWSKRRMGRWRSVRREGFPVDLTAQTGYSKADTVRFKWANNYKGRGYFCGQFAVPRNKSDEVVGSMIGS